MAKLVILLFSVLFVTLVVSIPTDSNVESSSPSSGDSEIQCKLHCKQTKEYKPLCGKDGRTYPNHSAVDCHNECAKAEGKPEIEVAHEGKCPTDRPKTTPVASTP
ncbi:hypothetical protein HHI36_020384 [Cryptolaemus montrouzieri]|uniref:Kazal-like domain-containing protein n=1 Tax=Cryptolaemus montrouzieri TaxID=559131 RepID=A0ABD2NA31_9CUCU